MAAVCTHLRTPPSRLLPPFRPCSNAPPFTRSSVMQVPTRTPRISPSLTTAHLPAATIPMALRSPRGSSTTASMTSCNAACCLAESCLHHFPSRSSLSPAQRGRLTNSSNTIWRYCDTSTDPLRLPSLVVAEETESSWSPRGRAGSLALATARHSPESAPRFSIPIARGSGRPATHG